jgi:trigger factor
VRQEDVRTRYEELIKEYVKNLQIPGFRKGKVPREVMERKFGSALKDEALNKLFGAAVTEIFEDETFPREDQPLPYSTPCLEGEPVLDFDKDLTFSVIYDVLPRVTAGPWKGHEVDVPSVTLGDEELNRELEELRERNAIVMDRNDGDSAAQNDVVTVDYCELDENNHLIRNSRRQDFVFTLGSGYNLYEFDGDIIGMKKGETKDITKTFPEDYVHKDYAGKTISLRVTLTALKEKKLPDLDDGLAQDVDEKFMTLDDLKTSIRKKLAENLEKKIRTITVSKIIEKIMEATPIDLPESMLRIELDSRWRNLARRFNVHTDALEQTLLDAGEDLEKLREAWRNDAEHALKIRLLIETLMRDLKLEASGEEVESAIESFAAEGSAPLEEVKKYYEQKNAREYLEEEIKERKLYDLLLAENTVQRGKALRYAEFMASGV